MERLALVAIGGGTGAVARYLAGVGYLRAFGTERPWAATLGINVLGGALMGVLIATLALRGGEGGDRWRLLLGVGVLGGFTTFSTFSLEAVGLLQRRAYGTAVGYVAASVLLSLAGLWLGLQLTRRVLGS